MLSDTDRDKLVDAVHAVVDDHYRKPGPPFNVTRLKQLAVEHSHVSQVVVDDDESALLIEIELDSIVKQDACRGDEKRIQPAEPVGGVKRWRYC